MYNDDKLEERWNQLIARLTEALPGHLDSEHSDYPPENPWDEDGFDPRYGSNLESEEEKFSEKFGNDLDELRKEVNNYTNSRPEYARGMTIVVDHIENNLYKEISSGYGSYEFFRRNGYDKNRGRLLTLDQMIKRIWEELEKLWIRQDTLKQDSELRAGIYYGIECMDEGVDFLMNYEPDRSRRRSLNR